MSNKPPPSSLPSSPGDNDSESASYTASLVQSAAKSLLDNSMVSDEGSLVEEQQHQQQQQQERPTHDLPSLSSLQIETLPALADEQDRKRFIGCLAAILSSSYEYDFCEDGEDDVDPNLAETSAYLEVYGYVKEEGDVKKSGASREMLGKGDTKSFDSSLADEVDDDDDEVDDDYEDLDSSIGGSSKRTTKRQESGSISLASKTSKGYFQRDSNAVKLSLNRHRRRRYEVLSEVLVNAGEYLGLESSQARAFLPLLAKLLKPPKRPAEEKSGGLGSSLWGKKPAGGDKKAETSNEEDEVVEETKSDSMASQAPSTMSTEAGETESEIPTTADAMEREENEEEEESTDELANDKDLFVKELDEDNFLRPFLESLSPGAGFRCLAMLLLEHLLRSARGYDARIRHIYKKLGVIVLVFEMEKENEAINSEDPWTKLEMVEFATRKFEALEHGLASKILELSAAQSGKPRRSKSLKKSSSKRGITKDQVIRGLKVGSAGVVAGTLFAVTGGLAAPAIATGLAAVAGSSAVAASVLAITTTTAAISSIFGVGGGGLVVYKMHRRQMGLTDFEFQKESGNERKTTEEEGEPAMEPELFTTICISGWLRDERDFQRPWGVSPWNPPIENKKELLQRFYKVYKPDNIGRAQKILTNWKGEEEKLWEVLEEKYGRDPDNLFPLEDGPRIQARLTLDQSELLDKLFVELGYAPPPEKKKTDSARTPLDRLRGGWKQRFRAHGSQPQAQAESDESTPAPAAPPPPPPRGQAVLDAITSDQPAQKSEEESKAPPNHTKTVWDYQATYGGELYTVRWESSMILELCNSVEDLAMEVVTNTTTQLLKQTAFAALVAAVAVPTILVKLTDLIDGSWTIAIERSDEAGRELARSLLFSRAGHRPVTLVGYSMGARAIYSCLKELAKYQEKWETMREEAANEAATKSKRGSKGGRSRKKKSDEELVNMREPASIVEDVILMGLPNHLSLKSWNACRQVVSGRLVNCFSKKDMILTLMFQYKRLRVAWKPVCGTCAVKAPGVENVDVSSIITGHQQYCYSAGEILKKVRHGQPIRGSPVTRVLKDKGSEET